MNKPASMVIKEFSDGIEKCINNSGLPPVIIEMRSYYLQIKELADSQSEAEKAEYTAAEKKEAEKPKK